MGSRLWFFLGEFRLFYQERTATWSRYSLTIEKLTVSMSARNSHAEA